MRNEKFCSLFPVPSSLKKYFAILLFLNIIGRKNFLLEVKLMLEDRKSELATLREKLNEMGDSL